MIAFSDDSIITINYLGIKAQRLRLIFVSLCLSSFIKKNQALSIDFIGVLKIFQKK